MIKLYRNRKGLSTVISTILMILVVMVGMSILFGYVAFYADNYKAGIGSSVMESLTIEDICLNSTGYIQGSNYYPVMLWVYNSGQIDAKINVIYINGIAATNGTSTIDFNIPVPVGTHVPITVQASSSWISGDTYEFRVNTVRGSNFEESIVAP
ncbi:MAG: hypothetical protein ABSA75_01900 [Candidatus Bathyarchaeia archaeon]|jgi:hypothetical protein